MVYVGQLPNTKFKEEDVLKLAESFGKVRKYFLNRIRREVIPTVMSKGKRCGLLGCVCHGVECTLIHCPFCCDILISCVVLIKHSLSL